jgi:asparagine synthase (glutamine-hydrolysing)
MCGITGIFDTREHRPIDRALLESMNNVQFHRGPVEGGVHLEPGVGFGHRRLSIIDLAGGLQPLFNEDHSVVLVFNGEIYNFHALMEELIALGHTFRTRCDTEVIVHGWEQWGEDVVQRLRGMFAFAIWDRNRQVFFMARDRIGIKPLFYTVQDDGLLLFGSELKTLMQSPRVRREIDPRAVEDFFAYAYVPDPRTIYKNVHKLAPGHQLTWRHGAASPQLKRYWDLEFKPRAWAGEDELAEAMRSHLSEAVQSHLEADVPLGAFLSGGVDSSAVVAALAGLAKEPVNSCSIGFDDPSYDESGYARQVAERYRTRHFSETVSSEDYGLIDTLAALYDEPYADSSAIPTYRVCELARRRVTVALSGDGGDENFAGYRRYRFALAEQSVRARIPDGLRQPLFGLLGKVYPKADWAPRVLRAKTTFEALARDLVGGYFHGVTPIADRVREQLFSERLRRELQGYRAVDTMRAHAKDAPTDDPLSLIQYLDFKTYLPGDILTKVDRASMAHALEVRVPLLDHKFVEFAVTVPPAYKLKGAEGKYILKRAMEPMLPHDVLYRPKMGFAIPLAKWLRGPLHGQLRQAIANPVLLDTGYFNAAYLRQIADEHRDGRQDHSMTLWTVLMFDAFLRNSHVRPAHGARAEAGHLVA